MISHFDCIVVVGGGQFDSLYGGPLKHPLTLWRWARSAVRAKVPYMVLSVGAQRLQMPSKSLIRNTISMSAYTSIRDSTSRSRIGGCAKKKAKIVPDLAYGYSVDNIPPLPSGQDDRVIVGISPMIYSDPRFYPESKPGVYQNHLNSLAEISARLLQLDHKIVLYTSDKPDKIAQVELYKLIVERVPFQKHRSVSMTNVDRISDLVDVLVGVDIVIAARLHGVLLAHLLYRPAYAIAHDLKVRTLMEDVGQDAYCQNIEELDIESGWRQIQEMIDNRENISYKIRQYSEANRILVDKQYDLIFGTISESKK